MNKLSLESTDFNEKSSIFVNKFWKEEPFGYNLFTPTNFIHTPIYHSADRVDFVEILQSEVMLYTI